MTDRTSRGRRRNQGLEGSPAPEPSDSGRKVTKASAGRKKRNKGWFPKGRSGNPLGRPPKPMPMITDRITEIMSEPIEATLGGQKQMISRLEVMVLSLVQIAINGAPRDRPAAVRELRQLGALDLVRQADKEREHIAEERERRREHYQALERVAREKAEAMCKENDRWARQSGEGSDGADALEDPAWARAHDEFSDAVEEVFDWERRNRKFGID